MPPLDVKRLKHEVQPVVRSLLEGLDSPRQHRPREVIFGFGEPADGLYLVIDGAVLLQRCNSEGRQVLFHVGLSGFWFGEMASLTGMPRQVEAVASHVPTRTARLRQSVVDRLAPEMPEVCHYFLGIVARRCALLLSQLEVMHHSDPVVRVAKRLATFLESDVLLIQPRPITEIPLSQSGLSEMTGLARQTVNRALRHLAAEGVVQCSYTSISILDADRLRKIGEGARG